MCCLTLPLTNVEIGNAASVLKPSKVTTMTQVMSKQLSGALKDAYVTDIAVTRQDTKSTQTTSFTLPEDSTVTLYCGFYRPTLFNFNVGIYSDAAGKNRVNGSYVSKQLGDKSAEATFELKAGRYYIIAEEVYMSSYKTQVENKVTTTTGSSIKVEEVTKTNPDKVTNKMYMGIAYLPMNNLVTHKTTIAGNKANIAVDARASSSTWESDVVALQYIKGSVPKDSDKWITQVKKAVDPQYSTEDTTIVLPTKIRSSGTKIFKLDLTGMYTFRICVTNGTTIKFYDFTETLDCTPPEITGVESGKTYRKAVTVEAKDAEGSYVTLTLNGQPYTAGTPIETRGKYRLVAKDANGNVTRCKFTLQTKKAVENG